MGALATVFTVKSGKGSDRCERTTRSEKSL